MIGGKRLTISCLIYMTPFTGCKLKKNNVATSFYGGEGYPLVYDLKYHIDKKLLKKI